MSAAVPGIELNEWMQSFSGPTLDAAFKVITAAGDVEFYLLLLPLIYWCLNKRAGIALTYLFLASAYLNTLLKGLFAWPRPYQAAPDRIRAISTAEGFALPSAHAQSSATVWGYGGFRLRRGFWIASVLVPIAIGISRIYLGVHGPVDVVTGWVLGAACVAVFALAQRTITKHVESIKPVLLVAASLLIPLLLALISPNTQSIKVAAALAGSSIGILLEARYVGFAVEGPGWKRALRFLLGALVAVAIHVSFKLALPSADDTAGIALSASVNAPRYFLVGVWVSFLAPWVFTRLRLAGTLPVRNRTTE